MSLNLHGVVDFAYFKWTMDNKFDDEQQLQERYIHYKKQKLTVSDK